MKQFHLLLRFIKNHYALLSILLIGSCLIFFRLGLNSLVSFDEAWYASIARNVYRDHQYFRLEYNDKTFTDHPPLVYWLMAFSYRLWGMSEFGVRFVSAILGVGTLGIIYSIGLKMKNKSVGLIAGTMLASSLWFLLRARSGNLDVPFLFFTGGTIYFLATSLNSKKISPWAAVFFALSLLSKSLVGLALLLPIGYVLYHRRRYLSIAHIGRFLIVIGAIVLPWYVINTLHDPSFLHHHIFVIALRTEDLHLVAEGPNLDQSLLYLRSGIGKWFLLSFFGLIILALRTFKEKPSSIEILVGLWLLAFAPFLLHAKTEVWHLIPLYPPLFLLTASGLLTASKWGVESVTGLISLPIKQHQLVQIGLVALNTLIFIIAAWQIYQMKELLYKDLGFDAEKDISLHARALPGDLYLKDVFFPVAIFYADRHIESLGFSNSAYQDLIIKLAQTNAARAQFIISDLDQKDLVRDQIEHQKLYCNEMYCLVAGVATAPTDYRLGD